MNLALELTGQLRGTTGQDKYCRGLQYGLNWLAETRLVNRPESYKKVKEATKIFSYTRKVIRFTRHRDLAIQFLRNYQNFKKAVEGLPSTELVQSLLRCFSDLTYFLYLLSDHLIYLENFLQTGKRFFSLNSSTNDLLWFVQEIVDLIVNLINLRDVSKDTKKQLILKLVRPANNLLNSLAALGFFNELISKKLTYLLGTITSLSWWAFFVVLK